MSTTTTNFNLIKPELTDVADITATNANWDVIDGELQSFNEKMDDQENELVVLDNRQSARNLLINSYFRNPINQRGKTSYSGSKYGIDRWCSRSGYCTVTVKEDCVNIKSTDGVTAAYVLQFIEPKKIKSGENYTAVCQLKDGSIHTVTADTFVGMTEAIKYIYVDEEQLGTIRIRYDSSEAMYAVMFSTISTVGLDIVNVALYEGEYDSETAPRYVPKGYENELLVCRQYDHVTGEYVGLRNFTTPRNLLDNSDFTNPINQRGQTSYTGAIYTIDRWRSWIDNNNVVINNGYVSISGAHFVQYIAQGMIKDGKTYTFAVCDLNGNIKTITKTAPIETEITENGLAIQLKTNDNSFVGIVEAGNYIWAALYEGEYTAETLPPYVAKGYGAELAECQRYYQKYQMLVGSASGWSLGRIYVNVRPVMRIKPTATVTNSGTGTASVYVRADQTLDITCSSGYADTNIALYADL
jgi:hypothetical protein